MDGIDISKKHIPEFGPLSLTYNNPIYIDDKKWSDILSYVWAQLLCNDTYKNIVRNWRSGFSNYLKTFKYDHETKKYYKNHKGKFGTIQPLGYYYNSKKEVNNQSSKENIQMYQLLLQTLEDGIEGITLLNELLEEWDNIDNTSASIFQSMKKNILSALSESNRTKKDKEGNIISVMTQKDAFLEFFRYLPFANVIPTFKGSSRSGSAVRGIYKKDIDTSGVVLTNILDSIDDEDENLDINSEIDRSSLIQGFLDIKSDIEEQKKEIEQKIETLKTTILDKKIDYFTREELLTKWKELPKSEKNKFQKSLKDEFLKMMSECRLAKFKEFLTIAYTSVLTYDKYKEMLLSTIPNIENYFKGGSVEWNNLIYIDPFNYQKPMLGVGILNHVLRGPNNVGRVLMSLRTQLVFDTKKHRDIEKVEKDLNTKKRFLLVHDKLRNLLKTRDIKDFLGLSVDEIIHRMNNAIRVNTPNRSFLVFPDCDVIDCNKLTITDIQQLLGNIVEGDIKIQSFVKTPIVFPEHEEWVLDLVYKNDINGIKRIFDYEQLIPGSLSSYLRKKELKNLYDIQVEEEKMTVTRAVLEFIYLSDNQKRIPASDIETIVTQELSNLSNIEREALIDVLDNAYITDTLGNIIGNCDGSCEEKIEIEVDEDDPKLLDIKEYVPYVLERDKLLGKLVRRIHTSEVNEANKWKFDEEPEEISITEEIIEPDSDELLNPRDIHISSLFSTDAKNIFPGKESKVGVPIDSNQMKMQKDIIFSSVPGQYTPFLLSPTAPIITTIDYFKFPTVLHSVCYLWFTREFNLSRNESYQMLLKENWKEFLTDLQIFEEITEIPFIEFKSGLEKKGLDTIAKDIEEKLKQSTHLITKNIDSTHQKSKLDLPVSKALLKHELFTHLLNIEKYQESPFISWDEAYNLLVKVMDQELFQSTKNALDKAHSVKFENEALKNLLLRTGESLIYHGDREDSVLGIGPNREGHNLAGLSLSKLRDDIRQESGNYIELDIETARNLANLFQEKIKVFGELIELLNEYTDNINLTIKLARGFLVLYKVNCGDGEGPPFTLSTLLHNQINSFSHKYNERNKSIKSLFWDYVKILYGQYILAISNKNIIDSDKSCMFDILEKTISKKTETNAKLIITKLFRCLLIEFQAQDKLKNIDELSEKIVVSNKGRAKYIGQLKLKNLTVDQKDQIINGEINYYNLFN